ncbi:MAG: hypothetical protein H6R02_3155 [Burkholderiaceae bacterium]|nr:hypothetical protein [Burkholderiaceae bacterium]
MQLASYTLVRVVAAWKVLPEVTLRARIENLFDAEYETISGYNVAPRIAMLGVDLRF